MSKSSYKFQEEVIKCPICSKTYTAPRVLPCLHSFCTNCLHGYIQGEQQGLKPTPSTTGPKSDGRRSNPPDVTKHPSPVQGKSQDTKSSGPKSQSLVNKSETGTRSPMKSPKPDLKAGKSPVPNNASVNKQDKLKPLQKDNSSKSPVQDGTIKKATKNPSPTRQAGPYAKSPMQDGTNGKKPTTNGVLDNTAHSSLKGFPCPCCRKFTTTPGLPKTSKDKWTELFPENNLLADLVELHSLKKGTRVCDPCKKNKTKSPIHSYCKNCNDALCEQCATTHKGLRSCRNHKVLSTSEFADAINSLKVEEEFCNKHPDNTIYHFCYVHAALCCTHCLAESHKACDSVVPVAEAAAKTKNNNDYGVLDDALDKYLVHVGTVNKDRTALLKRLDGKKSKVLNEFISLKNSVEGQLQKMEKDLRAILDSTHRQESKRIKTEIDKCQEIESAVKNTKQVLSMAAHHGSNSQVVETSEKVRHECEFYEENISILCSKLKTIDYNIALDPSLQQVLKRLHQFGSIDVHSTPTKLSPPPKIVSKLAPTNSVNQSSKPKVVQPLHTKAQSDINEITDFCARFPEDGQDCWFTGAVFLPDGRIILADRTNRKLKLFSSGYEPLTEVSLSSKPWDVTVISGREVAVSLPAECKIQFVTVTETQLKLTRSMSSDEPCFGLHFADDKILTVTYDGDPANLKILSLKGEELAYVCVDDDGLPLFSKPVYVTCTSDLKYIYVSDERQGCVVNLKESGDLNFTFSAFDFGHAAGLVVDKTGNLYVCDNASNCVRRLSAGGENVSAIVSGDAVSFPRAIAIDPVRKLLLVTQGDKESVKVYSLEQKKKD